MAIELRQITPTGGYGEILPDWSELTFSQDLLQPGTLTFHYPVDGRHADTLTHGKIFAVLLDGVEPLNGRFYYDEGTGSRIAEADGAEAVYGCTSVLGLGEAMKLAPAVGSTFADENLFSFLDKTPGFLARNVVNNAGARATALAAFPDWLTYPMTGFTDLADSAGINWGQTVDVRFNSGDSLVTVMDWLTSNGYAEPLMDKKVMRLYEPAHNGTNLAVGSNPVTLQTGRDFLEATYQTSSKDLVNSLLVLGENNSCAWVQDAASASQYGYREGTLSVSNASSQDTLTSAGQAWLSTRKNPRYSYTYTVSAQYLDTATGLPRPFVDYRVGDSVLILDGFATSVQRIRLMSATWPNSTTPAVNLTVNDLFAEREAEVDRRMSRLGI